MKGSFFFIREVIKVKRYKIHTSKAKFGDIKTFHKNLVSKNDLVLSDTCHHKNIQKEFESVMEADGSVRIVPPKEFIHRQLESGWQASTQLMGCWFQENRDELKKFFNQEFIGYKPNCGLKGLPPKNQLFKDSETLSKVVTESLAFSRSITSEVSKVMEELKSELQKKKEEAFEDQKATEDRGLFGNFEEAFVDEGFQDDQKDDEFNTEFRYSLQGNKQISTFAIRDSKEPGAHSREPSEKPVPKLTQNARLPVILNNPERPGLAATSTARTARGGKKGTTKTQPGTSLQTFFKNKKNSENPDNDDYGFN